MAPELRAVPLPGDEPFTAPYPCGSFFASKRDSASALGGIHRADHDLIQNVGMQPWFSGLQRRCPREYTLKNWWYFWWYGCRSGDPRRPFCIQNLEPTSGFEPLTRCLQIRRN